MMADRGIVDTNHFVTKRVHGRVRERSGLARAAAGSSSDFGDGSG